MSDDTGSPLFTDMHSALVGVTSEAREMHEMSPTVTNRIERDVLAQRAREAARYLAALADRLELFDA